MGSKLHFAFLVCCLLLFAVAVLLACEDNPEECYSDEDCGEGYICEPTYYLSGSRSGGVCHKTETEDAGDTEVSDGTGGAQDAAIQDSSQSSPIAEASTEAAVVGDAASDAQEAAVSGDAASDAPEAGAEAAVEGGQPPQPPDGGNVDSAN